ncbi:cytochrome c oxidase subunit 3 [Cytophagaceae bacterium ABcell3]|nr:cytochrome c oxidase subunit 3 [Cytophagaceae bacterium ABcell3]
MKQQELVLENQDKPYTVNPAKFLTWLFIVSIVMMFGALTSAYIVRRAEGNWLDFPLPNELWLSSLFIVVSSFTLHWGYVAAKKNNFQHLKLALLSTLVLGVIFLFSQFKAWQDLVEMNVFFAGSKSNPSGSFLYVLTGLHGFHIVSGLVFLLVTIYKAFTLKIHSKNLTAIQTCSTYWHFLGGLWIYLFVFLLFYR